MSARPIPGHGAALAIPAVAQRIADRRILECDKTGRHWPIRDEADGIATARRLGLVDYTLDGLDTPSPTRG